MPQESGKENDGQQQHEKTLAELLYRWVADANARRELEDFRIKFEAEFGETDLTKRYTSTWPKQDREWLAVHHPQRYWDGLPPFVQAFIRQKMLASQRVGKLDDMPDEALRFYLSGGMKLKNDRGGDGFQR